jgi:Protein of unknown function (DUF3307)
MFTSLYVLLAALFIKHWYIDFVNQSQEEIIGKGIYGNAYGVMHSIKHGVATAIIMLFFVFNFEIAVLVGFLDFLIHYHIDWLKTTINNRYGYTTEQPKFWLWLGADQLAHSLTYLWIVWLLF